MAEGTKANKKRMEQVAEDASEAAKKQEEPTQPASMTLEDLKVGYLVGLDPNGNFLFHPVGKEKGLVELAGLNRYAANRINQLLDNQIGPDNTIRQLAQIVLELSAKVDRLLPPQNKL